MAPFFQPYTETVGAGISEENPVDIFAYRYPVLTVRADMDEEAVYNILGPAAEEYEMMIGAKENDANIRTSQGSECI